MKSTEAVQMSNMAAPMSSHDKFELIRVLELYSGVGGMHYALKESSLNFKVVQAIDVNTNANEIYKLNFPETPISSSGIEGLTVKSLEKLNIDMILMSPPCQPFTRIGKKQDTLDPRTRSFLHLLDTIPRLKKYPRFILLENVKGFEESETHSRLIKMLKECNYIYQEFLLTPLQFGIPNSRLRYYLIARQAPHEFCFVRTEKIMEDIPPVGADWLNYRQLAEKTAHHCVCTSLDLKNAKSKPVKDRSSSSNNMMDRIGEENYSDPNSNKSPIDSDKEQSELQSSPCRKCDKDSDAEYLHKVGSKCDANSNSASTDEKSQIHSCAKRLKVSSNSQETICDKTDTEFSNATDDVFSSADTEVHGFCVENIGLNLRQQEQNQENLGHCLSLSHFLDDDKDMDYFKSYILPDNMLQHFIVMDIVNPCSRKSICFTKGYGKFVTGTGSVVQMNKDIQVTKQASMLKDQAVSDRDQIQWSDSELSVIRSLQLRYITPREVANILCFPKTFCFPDSFTNRQLYMLLGNSLNVHVVSVLIKLMVTNNTD